MGLRLIRVNLGTFRIGMAKGHTGGERRPAVCIPRKHGHFHPICVPKRGKLMAYLTCLAAWPPGSFLGAGREPGEVGAVPQGAPEVTGALQSLGLRPIKSEMLSQCRLAQVWMKFLFWNKSGGKTQPKGCWLPPQGAWKRAWIQPSRRRQAPEASSSQDSMRVTITRFHWV